MPIGSAYYVHEYACAAACQYEATTPALWTDLCVRVELLQQSISNAFTCVSVSRWCWWLPWTANWRQRSHRHGTRRSHFLQCFVQMLEKALIQQNRHEYWAALRNCCCCIFLLCNTVCFVIVNRIYFIVVIWHSCDNIITTTWMAVIEMATSCTRIKAWQRMAKNIADDFPNSSNYCLLINYTSTTDYYQAQLLPA